MKNIEESGPHVYPVLARLLSPSEQTGKYDLVFKLCERVQNERKIAEYMKSDRRQQFCKFGGYRHYPELDNEE